MKKIKNKFKFKIKKLKKITLKSLSFPIIIKIFLLVISVIFLAIILQKFLPKPASPVVDERPARIDAYFAKCNAPLAGYGYIFVREADKCNLDWRLLPAIAMQESSGGKYMQFNNPFGWGGAQIPYESIEEAIIDVTSHLCGNKISTAKWYTATSTETKLYRYNGTVRPTYPNEVMWIMEQF